MSERLFLSAAAVAGLLAGGGIACLLDFAYGSARSGRAGAMNRASTRAGSGIQPDRARRIILLAIATALVWAVAAARAVDLRQFLLMALFGALLLALTATDFERHLLPNRLLYPALLAALLLSAAWPGRTPVSALIGGAVGLGAMLAVFFALPGFGLGDVKLAGLIGLVLGFPGVVAGLLAGAILGGAGAAVLLATRRARLQTAIAYGPYLAGGAILEMLLRR